MLFFENTLSTPKKAHIAPIDNMRSSEFIEKENVLSCLNYL